MCLAAMAAVMMMKEKKSTVVYLYFPVIYFSLKSIPSTLFHKISATANIESFADELPSIAFRRFCKHNH